MRHEDEFEAFCVSLWPRLVGALAHHFGDVMLAEDLAQEALVRTSDRWEHVRTCASPSGWTFRVAVNAGNSYFRRRAAERRALHRAQPRPSAASAEPSSASAELRRALEKLTSSQRQVIIARFYLDLTVEEVSTHFDMSPGAVRAVTHRGIRSLRQELGERTVITEATDVR